MNKHLVLFSYLLITLFLIPGVTFANPFCKIPESEKTASDEFGCKVAQTFFKCRLEAEIAFVKLKLDKNTSKEYFSSITSCIQTSESEVEPIFSKAKSQLTKSGNQNALTALKDLYSYWLTSMNITTFSWSPPESEAMYKLRIKQKSQGIDERVNKLKVELL